MPDAKSGREGAYRWFVVATAQGQIHAAIIAGLLETADIPTHIYHESAGAAIGLTVGALGMTRILVPEAYYDTALLLLEENEDNLLDDGALPLDDGDTVDAPPTS